MSKLADNDTRTEATCRHCGQTIRHLPHGHKALAREARLIAAQCRECLAVAR